MSNLKNDIDQYLKVNVFDNEKPGCLKLYGGEQLQEEIDHLYEDVIHPRVKELEADKTRLSAALESSMGDHKADCLSLLNAGDSMRHQISKLVSVQTHRLNSWGQNIIDIKDLLAEVKLLKRLLKNEKELSQ